MDSFPKNVRVAFNSHKSDAKQRGIEFQFTLEEWWDWWSVDNRWANRGNKGHEFVMARKGDKGPYHPDNVYCATSAQNVSDIGSERRSRHMIAHWKRYHDKFGSRDRMRNITTALAPDAAAALAAIVGAERRSVRSAIERALLEYHASNMRSLARRLAAADPPIDAALAVECAGDA